MMATKMGRELTPADHEVGSKKCSRQWRLKAEGARERMTHHRGSNRPELEAASQFIGLALQVFKRVQLAGLRNCTPLFETDRGIALPYGISKNDRG
jgi:hypothetical protein